MAKYDTVLEIDEAIRDQHEQLTRQDKCFYFYEYYPGFGYNYSIGNNIILNFKKCVSRKGKDEYQYKLSAIETIANLLTNNFNPKVASDYTFVPIPPSKTKDDPLYDDRLVETLRKFKEKMEEQYQVLINIRELIVQTDSYTPAHSASQRPSVEDYIGIYRINAEGYTEALKNIILFDDVLTMGTHFKAAQTVISRHFKSKIETISGLFIARRVRNDL